MRNSSSLKEVCGCLRSFALEVIDVLEEPLNCDAERAGDPSTALCLYVALQVGEQGETIRYPPSLRYCQPTLNAGTLRGTLHCLAMQRLTRARAEHAYDVAST